jgi:archaellum component FlaC
MTMQLSPARIRPEVAGRIMVTIAAVGVLVGISATIVGWRLVGHLYEGVDDSLAVATQSLGSVDDSITVIESIVTDVRQGVSTLDRTVADVVAVTETSSTALDDLATQAPALAVGVESLRDGIAGAGEAGATIDQALESLDDLPGVPNYAPDEPLGETISGLTDDLDALATTLRSLDRNVSDVDTSVEPLVKDLQRAREDLAELNRSLGSSGLLLEQYRQSADAATAISVRTRDNLADDVRATRLLIVLGGLVFTVGQIVPFWLGRTILLEVAAPRRRVHADEGDV